MLLSLSVGDAAAGRFQLAPASHVDMTKIKTSGPGQGGACVLVGSKATARLRAPT